MRTVSPAATTAAARATVQYGRVGSRTRACASLHAALAPSTHRAGSAVAERTRPGGRSARTSIVVTTSRTSSRDARRIRPPWQGTGRVARGDRPFGLRGDRREPRPRGRVRVRVMEDVDRVLAVADLDREGLLGPGVGHGDEDDLVVRAPQEAYLDAVGGAAVELADERGRLCAHGCPVIGSPGGDLERQTRHDGRQVPNG